MKPFDFKLAQDGAPLCTKNGCDARIIYWDARGDHPIIALVYHPPSDQEIPHSYTSDGVFIRKKINGFDLMMKEFIEKRWAIIGVRKNNPGLRNSEDEKIASKLFISEEAAIFYLNNSVLSNKPSSFTYQIVEMDVKILDSFSNENARPFKFNEIGNP
jgi:hypothetical protein